ncbi:hypothetical protein POM88_027127 [Heracleum sosnowskyi]|uniref:Helitron helicase-like domain-containing protein n=1 Tax=Heracleum sosnowskyi TaxID=360622 RepID=A0AAD8I9I9_9APIA|nr:hypothetical protein POM88_027127 [Heracleum sosnowskyi]
MNQQVDKPVIIIISCARVALWNDEVEISNVAPTTFYLNYKHQSVLHLRRKLNEPQFAEKALNVQNVSKKELLTVDQIVKLGKEYIQVFTHVTIKSVEETPKWFMTICTTCERETELKNGLMMCTNYPRVVPHPDKNFCFVYVFVNHLPEIHEDPSTASSSSIPGNGSLLLNVFNYDLRMIKLKLNSEPRITPVSERLLNYDSGMMEEDVAPSNTIAPLFEESFLDENISFAKRTTREEFLHSPCANVSKCPLLFNVFNYDVSMMKEKEGLMKENYKPWINKENVDPQPQISAQKTTPQTGKCFSPRTPLSNVSNETRKRFSPRTPLSNVSTICDSSSCLQKEKWELNRPKKRLDTPLSTLTSIFDSNIKECTLGQNRSLLNTAQTLDFDMGRDFAQSDRTIDEIDYSRIVGFDVQEPDFYSDEEDVKDLNSWSYDNERKAGKDAVPIEYASLGAPNVQCDKCQACMWKEERTNKNVKRGRPEFSLCCAKGQIQLPKEKPTSSYLWQLYNDSKKGPRLKEGIRLYNSFFAFTSTGGRVDHSINCGGEPYIYRLNGQNHHLFGSLIPDDGQDPKFCQLYIYDTENEVRNRMKWINVHDGQTVHAEIVEGLMKMLDEKNELVKEFRTQRDRFKEGEVIDLEITLKLVV